MQSVEFINFVPNSTSNCGQMALLSILQILIATSLQLSDLNTLFSLLKRLVIYFNWNRLHVFNFSEEVK